MAALIAANLAPVLGVLLFDWNVFLVLVLFWVENVIIGLLNLLKMALASGPGSLWPMKFFLIPFFTVHYGGFAAGHGVFVFGFFMEGQGDVPGLEDFLPWFLELMAEHQLFFAVGALLISHLVSFVVNYLLRGEYRQTSESQLMMAPYGRVAVLHITIIAGGFAVMALGQPIWALLILIALKIGIDLKAHSRSHRKIQEMDKVRA